MSSKGANLFSGFCYRLNKQPLLARHIGIEPTAFRLGVLFYRKSGVKNAIFLDFRAFYALKCVYFEAFCSFRQVIFAFNTNFNTKNYTKTIPILIPVQPYTPMAASCRILYAFRLYLIISQIARKINVFSDIRNLIFLPFVVADRSTVLEKVNAKKYD